MLCKHRHTHTHRGGEVVDNEESEVFEVCLQMAKINTHTLTLTLVAVCVCV